MRKFSKGILKEKMCPWISQGDLFKDSRIGLNLILRRKSLIYRLHMEHVHRVISRSRVLDGKVRRERMREYMSRI